LTQETATQQQLQEKKARPLVPFLRIPDGWPKEPAYLFGSRCQSCGALFLGPRYACARCGAVENFSEVRLSDEGEIYVFTVIHQTFPGIEAPYIAAIIDLPEGVSVRANVYGLDPNQPDRSWFGKKVRMRAEKIRVDREGNDVIAPKYYVVQ
jgi:uncharacterized OB-fold protein